MTVTVTFFACLVCTPYKNVGNPTLLSTPHSSGDWKSRRLMKLVLYNVHVWMLTVIDHTIDCQFILLFVLEILKVESDCTMVPWY